VDLSKWRKSSTAVVIILTVLGLGVFYLVRAYPDKRILNERLSSSAACVVCV